MATTKDGFKDVLTETYGLATITVTRCPNGKYSYTLASPGIDDNGSGYNTKAQALAAAKASYDED